MNETVLRLLDEQNWSEMIVKLTAYVISYCKWKKYKLPKGLEAEDICMSAIEKVYYGTRNWDPEKEPDLINYLQGVINSIISNELKSGGAGEVPIDEFTSNVYVEHSSKEEEMYCKHVDEEIIKAMKEDPGLCLVYKSLKDGMKPTEIADEYGIEIQTIRLAQKKLRRLAEKVIDQLSKTKSHERQES